MTFEGSQKRNATLIYNPHAGRYNLTEQMIIVADLWRSHGWQVDIQPTQAAGHATVLAGAAAENGRYLVIAAGGDGTLGEVVNGLAESETILAPLPVGTANSFAKELQMPCPRPFRHHYLRDATEALLAGRVQQVDLGYSENGKDGARAEQGCRGRYWLLWLGLGTDGFLVEHIEPRPKWSKRLGAFGYLIQILGLLPRIPTIQMTLSIDGRQFSDEIVLALVSNCRRYAGGEVVISPNAVMDDGLFELALFHGRGAVCALRHLMKLKLGRHVGADNVTMVNGRSITIQSTTAIPTQMDGESGAHTPLTCVIKPKALRLLVPNTAPPNLFSQPGAKIRD